MLSAEVVLFISATISKRELENQVLPNRQGVDCNLHIRTITRKLIEFQNMVLNLKQEQEKIIGSQQKELKVQLPMQ